MALKEIVMSVFLAGTAAFSVGCLQNEQYKFHGKINGTGIYFYESGFTNRNYLTIVKPDGTKIKYTDNSRDFIVDYLTVAYPNGIKDTFSIYDDAVGKPVLNEATMQYKIYLHAILDNNERGRQQTITEAIETITR